MEPTVIGGIRLVQKLYRQDLLRPARSTVYLFLFLFLALFHQSRQARGTSRFFILFMLLFEFSSRFERVTRILVKHSFITTGLRAPLHLIEILGVEMT